MPTENEENDQLGLFGGPGSADEFGAPATENVDPDNDLDNDPDPDQEDEVAKRIAALEEQIAQERLNNARLEGMIANQPLPSGQPQAEEKDEPLPDFMVDPEGYAAALEKRIDKRLEREWARANSQNSQEKAFSDLWTDFKEKYPRAAKNEKLAEFLATNVAKEYAATHGERATAMILTNKGEFMRRVDEALDEYLPEADAPVGDNRPPLSGQTRGGQQKRRQTKKGAEEQPKSFVDQMKEVQLAGGFF